MGWVRTDDNASNHPKFFRAGPAAFGFWVAGLGYCNRNRTDGFIPARDLALVFVGITPGRALKLVQTLVEVGSWKTVEHGWQVHDYLRYQPSSGQIIADTDAAAKRYATWKQRRSNAVANEAIPQPNPTQPKEPRKKKQQRVVLTDDQFVEVLKASPAYKHLDIDDHLARMDTWLLANPGRQKTRRFIVGWLNRQEKPLALTNGKPNRHNVNDVWKGKTEAREVKL